jgi:hypothetical protein
MFPLDEAQHADVRLIIQQLMKQTAAIVAG